MTQNEQTIDRVKGIVGTVFKTDAAGLTEETRLVEDLHGKSMNTIELAALLEAEFGVAASCAVVRRLKTVGQIASTIDTMLEDRAST